MLWWVIVLSVLLVGAFFACANLLVKVEKLDTELTDVSLTLADVLTTVEQAYTDMKVVDSKGSFQSDDEVGHVFKALKQEIDMLRDKYIGEGVDGK